MTRLIAVRPWPRLAFAAANDSVPTDGEDADYPHDPTVPFDARIDTALTQQSDAFPG